MITNCRFELAGVTPRSLEPTVGGSINTICTVKDNSLNGEGTRKEPEGAWGRE